MRANRSGFWTHKLFAAELINKFTVPCSTDVPSLSPNIEGRVFHETCISSRWWLLAWGRNQRIGELIRLSIN